MPPVPPPNPRRSLDPSAAGAAPAFETQAGARDPVELLGGISAIRKRLTAGTLGSDFAKQMDALTAQAVTVAGLERFLKIILPGGLVCRVTPFEDDEGKQRTGPREPIYFTARWGNTGNATAKDPDAFGEVGRSAVLRASFEPQESALELRLHQVRVAPELRGRGSAGVLVEGLEAMLRSLSSHPDTEICLAGTGMGPAVWSMLGFQPYAPFAHEVPERFVRWLQIRKPLFSAAQQQAVAEAAREALHPWELGALSIPAVRIPVRLRNNQGPEVELPIGMAFLHEYDRFGSEGALDGSRFPNRPEALGTRIGKAYTRHCLAPSAGRTREARAEQWRDQLVSEFIWPTNPKLAAKLDALELKQRKPA